MQMIIHVDKEQHDLTVAYARGIQAGHRAGEYEGLELPQCPYPPGELNEAWHDGFGDGTEDYITYQRSD